MHWVRNYAGVLKSATDLRGNLYTDWRGKYIGHPGLIGLFQSDRVPDKYLIYIFPQEPAGTYLHTSDGTLITGDENLHIKTRNSIYEFTLDKKCISEDMIRLLIANALIYFDEHWFEEGS